MQRQALNERSFRISGFEDFVQVRTMDKVHEPSGSECSAPSSEDFRF
jgi:hypothetical protein